MGKKLFLMVILIFCLQFVNSLSIVSEEQIDSNVEMIYSYNENYLIYSKDNKDIFYYNIKQKEKHLIIETQNYFRFALFGDILYYSENKTVILLNLSNNLKSIEKNQDLLFFINAINVYNKINDTLYVIKESYFIDINGEEINVANENEINTSEIMKKYKYFSVDFPSLYRKNITSMYYYELNKKPILENYEIRIDNNILFDKTTGESYDLKNLSIFTNSICGVTKGYIFFKKTKIYGKSKFVFLIEKNYRTNQEKEIEINGDCFYYDNYFYAEPYLYDMYSGENIRRDIDYKKIFLVKNNLFYIGVNNELKRIELKLALPSATYETQKATQEYLEEDYKLRLEEYIYFQDINKEIDKLKQYELLFLGDLYYLKKDQIVLLKKLRDDCTNSGSKICNDFDSILREKFVKLNNQIEGLKLDGYILSPNLEKYEIKYFNNKSFLIVFVSNSQNDLVNYPIKEIQFSNFKLTEELKNINKQLEELNSKVIDYNRRRSWNLFFVFLFIIAVGISGYIFIKMRKIKKLKHFSRENKSIRQKIKSSEQQYRKNLEKQKELNKKHKEINEGIKKSQKIMDIQENKLSNLKTTLNKAIIKAREKYKNNSEKEKKEIDALKGDYSEAKENIKFEILKEKENIEKEKTIIKKQKRTKSNKNSFKKRKLKNIQKSIINFKDIPQISNYKDFKNEFENKVKKYDTIPDYVEAYSEKYSNSTKLKHLAKFIGEKINSDNYNLILTHVKKEYEDISVKKNKELPLIEMAEIDSMTGHQFEDYLDELFRKLGYESVATKKARDGGVDLILKKDDEKILVQAKRYAITHAVGVDAIRDVQAREKMEGATRLIVLTTSQKFSYDATKEAENLGVELWNRTKFKELLKKAKKLKE